MAARSHRRAEREAEQKAREAAREEQRARGKAALLMQGQFRRKQAVEYTKQLRLEQIAGDKARAAQLEMAALRVQTRWGRFDREHTHD